MTRRSAPSLPVVAWPKSRPENPYTGLLYRHMEDLGVSVSEFSVARVLRGPASIWHLHWPDNAVQRRSVLASLARAVAVLSLIGYLRRRGGKVVWTVHNLRSHEQRHPRLGRWFWRAFLRRLDGYIALTRSGREAARSHHPELRRIPGFVVPHGHYRGVYPDRVSGAEARARLDLPPGARVVAFVGQIRPYKGVPELVRTFRATAEPDDRLLVAGSPISPALEREVVEAAGGDPRVRLSLRFVPVEEMQLFLRAADLLVFPYREILNSGSALLALSFDRPILVPEIGSLGELREQIGDDWVRTYPDQLGPAVLGEALAWATARSRGRCEPLDRLSWRRLAADTLEAFREIGVGSTPATTRST